MIVVPREVLENAGVLANAWNPRCLKGKSICIVATHCCRDGCDGQPRFTFHSSAREACDLAAVTYVAKMTIRPTSVETRWVSPFTWDEQREVSFNPGGEQDAMGLALRALEMDCEDNGVGDFTIEVRRESVED
jgi:hypothetical protein